MEYREPRYYPFEELGGMYVHTNYESFKSNLGSFGGYGFELASLVDAIITKQKNRELEIENELKEIYGQSLSFKEILEFFIKPQGLFDRMKEKFITAIDEDETDFVIKFGKWAEAQYDVPKDAAYRMESLLNPIIGSLEQINIEGYINKDSLKKAATEIKSKIGKLKLKEKDTKEDVITREIRSLKGFIWEVYAARFFIEALKSIDTVNEFEVILQGAGKVADLKIDLKSVSIGVNIKSASTETFKGGYGITLFSNSSLGDIANIMSNYYSTDAIEGFKYYLINISRMKAFPLSGVMAGGLGHNKEGAQLIKSVLNTYATIFIGEQENLSGDSVSELYKQADILFTVDKIYLKSEILENIAYGRSGNTQENMESFLRISYSSSNDWEQFDRIKRRVMNYEKGDYAAAKNRGYMTSAVNSLLNQQASVKLRLLK